MTNVLFIRDLIYRLKQDYGQRMDLYVPCKSVIDFTTGKQTVSKRKYCFPKVVLLSEILQRRFVRDVAALAAGRNFAYGGLFDEGKRTIIVSGDDIPKGVRMDSSCYFVYNHIRYDIVKVEELEHRCGFIIDMSQVNKSDPYEVLELHAMSSLQWTGSVAND